MKTEVAVLGGVAIGVLLSAVGCGPGSGTYCQSGPKYGTDCYAEPDVRQPPGQPRRPDEESPRKGEPPATPPPGQAKWW